jgi:histidyl-tRNA synthetase
MVKEKKLKPELALGFTDRKGNELILKDRLIEIIKRNFQLYGFEPLETPGFEISENIGKFLPDEDRPMSGVFGFKDEKNWISLRYDLTAPLARYVAKNFDKLSKPFKRYQVGTVWRNEKPGPGRYREFTQIDADIVGTKNALADLEVCNLFADTLNKCGLNNNDYLIKFSNRKLIEGLLEELKITKDLNKLTVIRAVDKLDRVGIKGVETLLGEGRKDKSGDFTKGAGLDQNQIKKIIDFLKIEDWEKMIGFSKNDKFIEGGTEINDFISRKISKQYSNQIKFSSSLVRGIEYYTGLIFEANLLFKVKNEKGDEIQFGSVGGGGRYDNLIKRFTGSVYPATGISIGIDRLCYAMSQKTALKNNSPVVICSPGGVLFKEEAFNNYLEILRKSNINSEPYTGESVDLGTQLKYASKRNAPAAIIVGEDEIASGTVTIKNLKLGKEKSKDLKTREEWRASKPAQITVKIENLVDEIKKII